jgi:hypothetical protein
VGEQFVVYFCVMRASSVHSAIWILPPTRGSKWLMARRLYLHEPLWEYIWKYLIDSRIEMGSCVTLSLCE